jgi:hypothetical protein
MPLNIIRYQLAGAGASGVTMMSRTYDQDQRSEAQQLSSTSTPRVTASTARHALEPTRPSARPTHRRPFRSVEKERVADVQAAYLARATSLVRY